MQRERGKGHQRPFDAVCGVTQYTRDDGAAPKELHIKVMVTTTHDTFHKTPYRPNGPF